MRLPLLLVLVVGLPTAARGQDRPTLDDSLLRAYSKATPCPAQPPAAWLKGDPELAQKPICAVVAMAVARLTADPDPAVRAVGVSPTCVTSFGMTGHEMPTTNIGADGQVKRASGDSDRHFALWAVTFIGEGPTVVRVSVNRFTGAVSHWARAIDAQNPIPKACQR